MYIKFARSPVDSDVYALSSRYSKVDLFVIVFFRAVHDTIASRLGGPSLLHHNATRRPSTEPAATPTSHDQVPNALRNL